MRNPTTKEEALDNLKDVAQYYFEKLGWKDIPIEKRDEDTLSINGWILITPFLTQEQQPSLLGFGL